jgi:protein-L-isoaspartate(D-aspartate) O-methyltransferase
MIDPHKSVAEARAFHAKLMAAASGRDDPRLEEVFRGVSREDFMPKGAWHIRVDRHYIQTPSNDPRYLYQNALVALDRDKGINNGEPYLHAAWLGAVAPQPGEHVCHIGAGTGYYTAILSRLVQPGGKVQAFEIDEALAKAADANLAGYEGVTVANRDATKVPIPRSDLIYVNAGVVAPPAAWLEALRLNGRMIFPWQPAAGVGLTLVVTRTEKGFAVRPLMRSVFIGCVGASSSEGCEKVPTRSQAPKVRSVWLTADRSPDKTAIAICGPVWFSTERLV